jgi:hypothetical protein
MKRQTIARGQHSEYVAEFLGLGEYLLKLACHKSHTVFEQVSSQLVKSGEPLAIGAAQ